MSNFEILRPRPGPNFSLIIPTSAGAQLRGQGIMRDPSNGLQGIPADGAFAGYLVRDVVVGGPTDVQRAQLYPGELELPDTLGGSCSLRAADEVIMEGPSYVETSGTGFLTTGTAINSKLAWKGGKLRVAQAGDQVYGYLANQLTPETAGNVRVVVQALA